MADKLPALSISELEAWIKLVHRAQGFLPEAPAVASFARLAGREVLTRLAAARKDEKEAGSAEAVRRTLAAVRALAVAAGPVSEVPVPRPLVRLLAPARGAGAAGTFGGARGLR